MTNRSKTLSKTFMTFVIVVFFSSCKYDNLEITSDDSNFPPDVSNIIIKKCATAGCHNEQSKSLAAGLSLETWDKMFEGGRSGAAVIPFRPDYSTLMFIINTDSANGLIILPTMPYASAPLVQNEYTKLKDWIQKGAPDKNGLVKFSDNQSKEKLYVSNQSSDNVTVFDVASGLEIRYIDVGSQNIIEVPHMIKVSPDNQFWYAVFYSGNVLQKFRTSDNSHVADAAIGSGAWNTIAISPDSKKAYVVDMETNGKVAVVDLENMTSTDSWNYFEYPHGSALNKNGDTLYLTAQNGNFIYKIPVNDASDFIKISLDPLNIPSTIPSLDPHEILFNADYSKYYVSCERSNEVRVMQTSNDSLLAVIQTSEFPVEMSMSNIKPYLFVTCMSAVNAGLTIIGRVDVIDVNTNAVIKSIMTGHQPHGIAVSDKYNKVFVGNRNASHGGPPPHHGSLTVRNGYINAIDMTTLDLVPGYKAEVALDPYGMAITH